MPKTQVPSLTIAPAGMLINLVRVIPSSKFEEKLYNQSLAKQNRFYYVLGEWDLLRLTLTESLYRPQVGEAIWPPDTAGILNHHSFMTYIWQRQNQSDLIQKQADGTWTFGEYFCNDAFPILLLICIKLEPRLVAAKGIEAEKGAVSWLYELGDACNLATVACGGFGWKELFIALAAPTLEEARHVLRTIFDATVGQVFQEGVQGLEDLPLAVRTTTYPCVNLSHYLKPPESLDENHFKARVMVDFLPAICNPLYESSKPFKDIKGLSWPFKEQFGEYDALLDFEMGTSLYQLLLGIKEIRHSNGDKNWGRWLKGTTTILSFMPPQQAVCQDRGVPFSDFEAPLDTERIIKTLSQAQPLFLSPIQLDRILNIINRVGAYGRDPVLVDSVKPFFGFLESLGYQLEELGIQSNEKANEGKAVTIEPQEIDSICTIFEYAIRQRSEGLQQFLFNALPSNFFSRGGVNRVLRCADGILQEVSDLFNSYNPGFVVFGMPIDQNFNAMGPIVTAPIRAVFNFHEWWVIYHEAACYLNSTHFGKQGFEADCFHRQGIRKLVPDILTLAMPFRGDTRLFVKALAYQFAQQPPEKLSDEFIASVLERITYTCQLWRLAVDFRQQDGWLSKDEMPNDQWLFSLVPNFLSFMADDLQKLENKGCLPEDIDHLFIHFFDSMKKALPAYRSRDVPEYTENVKDQVFYFLCELPRHLNGFWNDVRIDGNKMKLSNDLVNLIKGLILLAQDRQPHEPLRIFDLVNQAIKQVFTPSDPFDKSRQANFESFIDLFLKMWHRSCQQEGYHSFFPRT